MISQPSLGAYLITIALASVLILQPTSLNFWDPLCYNFGIYFRNGPITFAPVWAMLHSMKQYFGHGAWNEDIPAFVMNTLMGILYHCSLIIPFFFTTRLALLLEHGIKDHLAVMKSRLPSWNWRAWLIVTGFITSILCFLVTEFIWDFGNLDNLCWEYDICSREERILYAPMWLWTLCVSLCWKYDILHDDTPMFIKGCLSWVFHLQAEILFGMITFVAFDDWIIPHIRSELRKVEELRAFNLLKKDKTDARYRALTKHKKAARSSRIEVFSKRINHLKAIMADPSTPRLKFYRAVTERGFLIQDMDAGNVEWTAKRMSKRIQKIYKIPELLKKYAAAWKMIKEHHFSSGKCATCWLAWVESHILEGPQFLGSNLKDGGEPSLPACRSSCGPSCHVTM